jgi:hypothetical protein
MQCSAAELDPFTGVPLREAAQRGGALGRAFRAPEGALGGGGPAAVGLILNAGMLVFA